MAPNLAPESAARLVAALQTALSNYRSYPPTTLLVERSIGTAFDNIEKAIGEASTVTFSPKDDHLEINGRVIPAQDNALPQVKELMEWMKGQGVTAISFNKGVDAAEFTLFIEIMGKNPHSPLAPDGTLPPATLDRLPHIRITVKSTNPKRSIGAAATGLSADLRRVEDLAALGDTDGAVQILYELIVRHAKEKQFKTAETLSKKLYEIDPMALSAIVKANEIIEAEKKEAVDPDHMRVWKKLYDTLSPEETNTLFYELDRSTVSQGGSLVQQGEPNRYLYFIDDGSFALSHAEGGVHKLLTTLGPGQVMGQEVFGAVTVCTASAVAVSTATVSRLDVKSIIAWAKTATSLFRKLEAFCASQKSIAQMITEKGMDRRGARRWKIDGTAILQFPNKPDGTAGRKFQGHLVDISARGVQVLFKAASQEVAGMLLGRRIFISFELSLHHIQQPIRSQGIVMAVQSLPFEESTLHMRFEQPIGGPAGEYLIHPPLEEKKGE